MSLIECFDALDDITARLVIQLQLEDIQEWEADQRSGHERANPPRAPNALAPGLFGSHISMLNYRAHQGHQAIAGPSNVVPQIDTAPAVTLTCSIHLDDIPVAETFTAPCGCHYCREAINDIFRRSLGGDESNWPARCCGERIFLTDVVSWLREDVLLEFLAKEEEMEDPHRVYCPAPACSRYIGASHRYGSFAVCPECYREVCLGSCKGPRHEGPCVRDDGVDAMEELADREGWRRCPNDGRMIEKESGCNHMTCVCGCEFCYVCGHAPWQAHGVRQCRCPQFEGRFGWE